MHLTIINAHRQLRHLWCKREAENILGDLGLEASGLGKKVVLKVEKTQHLYYSRTEFSLPFNHPYRGSADFLVEIGIGNLTGWQVAIHYKTLDDLLVISGPEEAFIVLTANEFYKVKDLLAGIPIDEIKARKYDIDYYHRWKSLENGLPLPITQPASASQLYQ